MAHLFVVLDGLGDRPCRELKGKTPLAAARTPFLDKLVEKGKTGLLYTIDRRIAPESDQAMLSLLGFDPFEYYTGRGGLEAYGAGVRWQKGQIVLRGNMAKVQGWIIKHIEWEKGIKQALSILNRHFKKRVKFVHTVGHRFVAIMKGHPAITNTHPGYQLVRGAVTTALPIRGFDLEPLECRPLDRRARESAALINEITAVSKRLLKDKVLLFRGASTKLPKLKKLRKWSIFADIPVEKAIGKLCGMSVLRKESNLQKLATKVEQTLRYSNVYVQLKKTDTYSHQGKPILKKKAIEEFDLNFLGNLSLDKQIVCITGDHSTPSTLMAHSRDPVPFLLFGKGKDSTKSFSAKECRHGSLGTIFGKEVMQLLR